MTRLFLPGAVLLGAVACSLVEPPPPAKASAAPEASVPSAHDADESGASALPHPTNPVLVVRMEKTGCLGACPVFVLSVLDDGSVKFDGRAHVEAMGVHESRLSPKALGRIRDALERAHLPAFVPAHPDLIDVPTTELSWGKEGRQVAYLRPSPAVHAFETTLATETGLSNWIGNPEPEANSELVGVLSGAVPVPSTERPVDGRRLLLQIDDD